MLHLYTKTFVILFVLLTSAFASLAQAAAVYTYSGNNFTNFIGGAYDISMSVTGSFEVATPLGANRSLAPISWTSFSFSDGIRTFDNTSSGLQQLEIATDGSGDVSEWIINLM